MWKRSHVRTIWKAIRRDTAELDQLTRIVAERAFIAAVQPTARQIATWKANGDGSRALSRHVFKRTGKIMSFSTAERLWRLFSAHPHPRRARTIYDFVRKLPPPLRCEVCKTTVGPFHIDHVIALRNGGRDDMTNLQVLCCPCNLSKGPSLDPIRIYIEFEN